MDNTYFEIEISETTKKDYDMADLLRHIAGMIDEGYTSGYDPTWNLREKICDSV